MIPIEVALNYYEDKITENIQSLQDEIIATIIKENNPISIRISNITTHQYTERTHIGRLQFKFNDTPITIRIGLNSRKLRVYFHRNNNSVHNSWSVLINLDQNNEKISFQALSWNVRGGQLSKHFIFWYGDNKNLLLDEEFKDIAPNPTLQNGQAVILSKEIPEFFVNSDTFNNNNLTEIGKGQLDAAANIHAKTIVVRCLDWILYNAYISNANLDFDLERNINIRDRLFPTDFFPVENAETPAQPRHRITAHELRLKCEGKGLYYSHDIYQTIATSMNLGRHLILTGPPGCGKSRLAELVGEMVNGTPPKIVTASPSWTSGEIVGRGECQGSCRAVHAARGCLSCSST